MQTKPATDDNRPRQTTPVRGPGVAQTIRPLKPLKPQATASQAATTQQLAEVRAQAAASQAATTQQLAEVRAQAAASQAAATQQLAEVRAQAAASQVAATQQLKQVRKHLQEMSGKLRQLTANPTKTQWTLLSTSVELLSARQEIMMSDLNAIRDKLIDGPVNNDHDVCDSDDSDVSTPSDDLGGPITPDESCYLGTPLCHCREDDRHHQ